MDPSRPPYLRPTFLLLVLVGGTLGTAVRSAMKEIFPPAPDGWPWATFGSNVAGSFLLGLLLTSLAGSGWGGARRQRVWLGAGTGVLGGLTTYSTFAAELVQLVSAGHPVSGLGYGAVSVVCGIAAAAGGYLLGGGSVATEGGAS